MEEENGESEKEFPGLYASEVSHRSDSDYGEGSFEKGGKKELLRSKKKEKKDLGYAALDAESSGEEMDFLDVRNPLKSKRTKSFKFLQKKDKEEKEIEKKDDKKKKDRDDKDDKKKEKKKEKEERKREKEEKKKIKKDKKKKNEDTISDESFPIFGAPLSVAVERSPSYDGIRLPAIVRECIDFLEEKGLNCEGIYRLGGVKSKVQNLRRSYNEGECVQLDDQQPHVVASLLKQYLRELPETVLTVDMMPHFEDVSLIPNPRERAEAMRQLIDRLPTTNRLLLQYMLKHMGHVIEREKDTKMSYHNVCVVLSPTMQISHRVLNVMFHSHHYLFGNVEIKRYISPITSYSGANRTIEDLKTSAEIEDEIGKQESLLSTLHSAIAAGRISRKREEQLWEAQRIVTLLKRRLKSVQRNEIDGTQRQIMESSIEREFSSEESQKEGYMPISRSPYRNGNRTGSNSKSEYESDRNVTNEMKSSSETDTGTPSFQSASCNFNSEKLSGKSSEEESEKSITSSIASSNTHRKEVNTETETCIQHPKEQVFPILPKPISARAERNKLAKAGREKSAVGDSSYTRRNEDVNNIEKLNTTIASQSQLHNRKLIPPSVLDNKMEHTIKAVPFENTSCELDNNLRINRMSEIIEEGSSKSLSQVRLPGTQNTTEKKIAKHKFNIREHRIRNHQTKPGGTLYSEDSDYELLIKEEITLNIEHEELLAMNHELTQKLKAEKAEISRLRDEIQEMQTLYGYRTHSYDSSESDGSESEGESDTEEEVLKQIIAIDNSNKQIKFDNQSLTKRIQDEREAVILLRVALRQTQATTKLPQIPAMQVFL